MTINPQQIGVWIGVITQLVTVGKVTEEEIRQIYSSLRGSSDVDTEAADNAMLEQFSQIIADEKAKADAAAGLAPGYSFQTAVPTSLPLAALTMSVRTELVP